MKTAFLRSATLGALIVFGCTEANAQFAAGQVLTASQLNSALAAPTITGGSINGAAIGASVPSTGAFTTLTASGTSTLHGVTMPATGQFYAGSGASISRIQDRLFVGPAALNNGTAVASQPDWLTTYQLAKGRTYGYIQTSQMAVLNGPASQDSVTTFVTGAQTLGRAGGSQAIAVTGMGVNNQTSGGPSNQAWAGYFEAFRDTGTAGNGGAYGIEIDTMNYVGSAAVTDPYAQSSDQTVAAQLASGGGFPGTLYPTTVGLNFQNNNTTFDKGIVFGSNSITGATGTSGSGIAIALGNGHTLQWYGGAGVPTSSILSTGTTQSGGTQLLFSDGNASFNNASAKPVFKITGVSNGVNGIQAIGAVTGNAVALNAVGDDSNISLTLSGKGTGGVNTIGATDGSSPCSGCVGQVVPASFSSVGITTSGTPQNLASISLPPGDWYVEGYVTYSIASGATITSWLSGVNTSSATIPSLGNYWQMQGSVAGGANAAVSAIAPVSRQNVTANTTVYLVGQAAFSGGVVTASGYMRATRRP
ncbi:hypothetical protein [Paraburkholderia phenoliruptrix]|uniref:hypothetical protein n=1 Tax=Paraburkholderia phenoliruptrix TaxID=252970 RepID=UPI001C4EFA9E|nr:hypothetical protein [Paraburkholderia phenoliruptrix]MBW0449025.1 hypothetical protein [Paraburkholderia phenoliruptrix]MBW9097434.1 hypothetical protein [Paraburkholderia phenoliruptrix]